MVTQIPTSDRFWAPNVSKARWLPAIAATTLIPVYAEWDAGTDLSDEVAEITGFSLAEQSVSMPGLGGFAGSLPGARNLDGSAIDFYADDGEQDVRTVLAHLQAGFLCIADNGDDAGSLMDVFKVTVGVIGTPRSVTGSTARLVHVPFHSRTYAQGVAIPASV